MRRIVAAAGVANKDGDYDEANVRPLTLLMQGMWRLVERWKADEEKKALEAGLLQAHKMEAIGTVAGGIAHDFNNILSAMLGCTELAQLKLDAKFIGRHPALTPGYYVKLSVRIVLCTGFGASVDEERAASIGSARSSINRF